MEKQNLLLEEKVNANGEELAKSLEEINELKKELVIHRLALEDSLHTTIGDHSIYSLDYIDQVILAEMKKVTDAHRNSFNAAHAGWKKDQIFNIERYIRYNKENRDLNE